MRHNYLYRNRIMISGMLIFSVSANAAELKDPTRPPFYQSDLAAQMAAQADDQILSGNEPWVLNSTFISGTHSLAMINGRLLGKGDKLGNMTVVDIKSDKALLKVDSERIVVSLVPNSIKSAVNKDAPAK